MFQGPLFIVSGPSGCGKSTVIARVLAETEDPLRLSVSVTTRPPRPGEEEGVHYHFWTRDGFEKAMAQGAFLEWAEVYGNLYGTLEAEVEPYRRQGVGVILEIDVKGWEQVRRRCPEAVSIFLRTSSLVTYEQRLRKRQTETEEALQRRLQGARAELARAPEYDFQVINDDLETAVNQLGAIIHSGFAGQEKNKTPSDLVKKAGK